jgi:hypothetical protein
VGTMSLEEEGASRPSPTASFFEAYHAAPPPPTLRNLVARDTILANDLFHGHTPNLVIRPPKFVYLGATAESASRNERKKGWEGCRDKL